MYSGRRNPGLGSCKGSLGVNDPLLLSQGVQVATEVLAPAQSLQSREELKPTAIKGLLEQLQEASAEEAGEYPHGQEEPRTASDPALTVGGESATWYHAVQVRVMYECLSPGMQDSEEADLGPQVLRVGSNRTQGIGGGSEEKVIDGWLVLICDCGDFLRKGEDNVKVRNRKEFGLTILDPLRFARATDTSGSVGSGNCCRRCVDVRSRRRTRHGRRAQQFGTQQ